MAILITANRNHQCLECGRQFVADSQLVNEETKELIKRLLLERLSLSGICRATGISLRWLLNFIAELYDTLPDDLSKKPFQRGPPIIILPEVRDDSSRSAV